MCFDRSSLWAMALLFPLALGALAQDRDRRPEARPAQSEVARLFEKSCSSCHVVPDASFETDRAWLGQLSKTA